MLNSFSSSSFQISCFRFLNTLARTSSSARVRVRLQAEMEEAGLSIPLLLKLNKKVSKIL